MRPRLVGRVVIPRSVPRFSGGVLQVQLEDVSCADRAAVVAAEMTVSGVEHDPTNPDGTIVWFALSPTGDLDPTADYSVRASLVQAETTGHRALQMHSDQAYPVLTRGFGDEVTIVLEQWTRDQ